MVSGCLNGEDDGVFFGRGREIRRLYDDPAGFDTGLWKEMSELGWVGLVIEEGDIIARGTHDHLLEHSPEYADIVHSQLQDNGGIA